MVVPSSPVRDGCAVVMVSAYYICWEILMIETDYLFGSE